MLFCTARRDDEETPQPLSDDSKTNEDEEKLDDDLMPRHVKL